LLFYTESTPSNAARLSNLDQLQPRHIHIWSIRHHGDGSDFNSGSIESKLQPGTWGSGRGVLHQDNQEDNQDCNGELQQLARPGRGFLTQRIQRYGQYRITEPLPVFLPPPGYARWSLPRIPRYLSPQSPDSHRPHSTLGAPQHIRHLLSPAHLASFVLYEGTIPPFHYGVVPVVSVRALPRPRTLEQPVNQSIIIHSVSTQSHTVALVVLSLFDR
jgi:hypothetical protein